MKKRVVVTGMGAITPIGIGVEEFWKGIKEEKIGFDRISYFDTTPSVISISYVSIRHLYHRTILINLL